MGAPASSLATVVQDENLVKNTHKESNPTPLMNFLFDFFLKNIDG